MKPHTAYRHIPAGIMIFISAILLMACAGVNSDNVRNITSQITRKNIDFNNIHWFARRAEAAYSSENKIKSRFPQTKHVNTPAGTGVQYFLEILPQQKMQIISIRGSANLKNIIEDMEYTQKHDNKLGIEVHRGFHDIAVQIYKDVKPHLKRNYKVAATGHSLGAASSVILLMYLSDDGFSIAPSSNFGQPRITNAAGVKRFANLPVTRIIDANDAVPMFPLSETHNPPDTRYEHIGEEVILLKPKYFVYLDKHDANRISVGEFKRNFARVFLKNHSIKKYIQKISELETEATQVPYKDRRRFEL